MVAVELTDVITRSVRPSRLTVQISSPRAVVRSRETSAFARLAPVPLGIFARIPTLLVALFNVALTHHDRIHQAFEFVLVALRWMFLAEAIKALLFACFFERQIFTTRYQQYSISEFTFQSCPT